MYRHEDKARTQNSSKNSRVVIDSLEARQHFAAAPTITAAIADNRGEVTLTASRFLRNVSKNSVRVYTAGTDAEFGTNDDSLVPSSAVKVSFNEANSRISVRATVAANVPYLVRLLSSRITAVDSKKLDGEFSGSFPTGNGSSGGTFEFVANPLKASEQPTVRMNTSLGLITLRIRRDVAPNTAAAFLTVVNGGGYDASFFTRGITDFILQGGALRVSGGGTMAADVVSGTAATVPNEERELSNTRGTVSLSTNGQFFVNVGNNDDLSSFNNLDEEDSNSDPAYTPFAEIIDGLSIVDAIMAKPQADLSEQVTAGTSIDKTAVPVNSNPTRAEDALNPNRDLIVIRRAAVRMRINVVPPPSTGAD